MHMLAGMSIAKTKLTANIAGVITNFVVCTVLLEIAQIRFLEQVKSPTWLTCIVSEYQACVQYICIEFIHTRALT